MTACGVVSTPSSRTRNVFCQSWPNPWSGPDTRFPVTASSFAPTTPAADRRSTGFAQFASDRFVDAASAGGAGSFVSTIWVSSVSGLSGSGGRSQHGGALVVHDLDGFVEASELEDLAVVIGQACGDEASPGALGADEER